MNFSYIFIFVLVITLELRGICGRKLSIVVHHEENFAVSDLHEQEYIESPESLERYKRSPPEQLDYTTSYKYDPEDQEMKHWANPDGTHTQPTWAPSDFHSKDWSQHWSPDSDNNEDNKHMYTSRIPQDLNQDNIQLSPRSQHLHHDSIHARKKRSPWSPDDFAQESKWELSYTTPVTPTMKPGAQQYEELETKGAPPEEEKVTVWLVIKYASAPITLLVMILLMYCVYRCCIARDCPCCSCLSPQKMGQSLVQDYVPGAKVGPDGKVEFVQPTEEEMEALKSAVMELV